MDDVYLEMLSLKFSLTWVSVFREEKWNLKEMLWVTHQDNEQPKFLEIKIQYEYVRKQGCRR